MKCPSCNKEIENNAKFCGYCGFNLVSNDAHVVNHKSLLNKKRLLFVIPILVIVLLSVIFIPNHLERKRFDKALRLNTVESFDAFLEKYPNSEFTSGAEFHRDRLIFEEVLNKGTKEAFVEYLTLYPNSLNRYNALSNISAIEQREIYIRKKKSQVATKDILRFEEARENLQLTDYTGKLKELSSTYYKIDPNETSTFFIISEENGILYREPSGYGMERLKLEPTDKSNGFRINHGGNDIQNFRFYVDNNNYLYLGCDNPWSKDKPVGFYKSKNKVEIPKIEFPGLYPQASQRLLVDNDLSPLSKEQLRIMRNEIFARHGYVFKTDAMNSYFNSKGWYISIPKLDRNNDASTLLSEIEKANIKLIQKFEKEENLAFSQFKITKQSYSETSNFNSIINNEFGSGYRVADWNDILLYKNEIEKLVSELKINSKSEFKSLMVTKNNEHWYGSKRHYFITFHNHKKESSYLAHDHIDSYYISLGSWYGIKQHILCIKK